MPNLESPQDSTEGPVAGQSVECDPKGVLALLGKKAEPEERDALLKIGTDLIDGLL
jgi:hypothetical protein